ncbi:hypothetical protein RUR49_01135 [Pseudoxanthobacter sp. M-2]|uniref:DUF2946 family protein n=1 Tax=Pseudoxanthobacter sp. M-2 TaxID=3078754 RepID=UPI0038FCFE51
MRGFAIRRRRRLAGRPWLALAAVWLFAFQSALATAATGAPATPVQLDAFGGVICTTGAHPGEGEPASAHGPACCILGCMAACAGAGCPPDLASLYAPQRIATVLAVSVAEAPVAADLGRTPRQARAPPPVH